MEVSPSPTVRQEPRYSHLRQDPGGRREWRDKTNTGVLTPRRNDPVSPHTLMGKMVTAWEPEIY